MKSKVKIAVLIGGGGRLKAIYQSTQNMDSQAEIGLVVSFKRASAGLEWAAAQGLAVQYLRWFDFKKQGLSRLDYDKALIELLKNQQIELVVLAGWGILLTPLFLREFAGRVINVHPALLTETWQTRVKLDNGHTIPVFRGNDAINMALAAGVSTTGCSVHYVTEKMDTGPIIIKREVRIYHNDTTKTLADRIHKVEDEILPLAIENICLDILKSQEQE